MPSQIALVVKGISITNPNNVLKTSHKVVQSMSEWTLNIYPLFKPSKFIPKGIGNIVMLPAI